MYISLAFCGCASWSSAVNPNPTLKSGQDFVSAANALAQAESAYWDEIQAASDSGYRLRAIRDYVKGKYVKDKKDWSVIYQELNKREDFSQAKKLRLNVMKQLQNYAAVISSIESGADASWISTNAKNLINNTGTLVHDFKGPQLTAAQNGMIDTIVTDLGQAVVKAAAARKLQTLAKNAQKPIDQIVAMVDADNKIIEGTSFAGGLGADQTYDLVEILHDIYNDKRTNAYQRFVAAQTVINWKPSLVTKGQAIMAAATELKEANQAMAQKHELSAIDLVRQAFTSATGATNTPSVPK